MARTIRSAGMAGVLLLILLRASHAGQSVELLQAFRDLHQDGVLMDLSAHPDDEDGSTLAMYRMKYGVKTCSVLFTRGEGGQNEKGPELYEQLGVLRSAETRAAGAVLGAEVHFLNFLDFGYSKTATEAFRVWGGQMEVLRRLVYVIRKEQPDILFTNHSTAAGHGHHQAVAITAIAAFVAAGDSTMFPEQIPETGVWQPRKLYARQFGKGEALAEVANDIQAMDTARGQTYLDIASSALRMHKTQGMERADLRRFTSGKSLYALFGTNSLYEPDSTTFFGGIDFWRDHKLAFLLPIHESLSLFHDGMSADSLLMMASHTLRTLDSLDGVPGRSPLAKRLIRQWRTKLERLVQLQFGVEASVTLGDSTLVPRQTTLCAVHLTAARGSLQEPEVRISIPSGWTLQDAPADDERELGGTIGQCWKIRVGEKPVCTLPRVRAQYRPIEEHQEIVAHVGYRINGVPVSLSVPARFEVSPEHTMEVTPLMSWCPPDAADNGIRFSVEIRNHFPYQTAGKIQVMTPPGWRAETPTFAIADQESSSTVTVTVSPKSTPAAGEYTCSFRTEYANESTTIDLFSVASAPGLKVGIVKSYDTTLVTAVRQLGVPFSLISDEEIAGGNLSEYSTIVLDIRGYLVRDALKDHNANLLEYVRKGGNLLVMYQRETEWKPEYAPYPFKLSRKRVSMEDAPVTVLRPEHPLVHSPNEIRASDWDGWRQERAVYMPVDVPPEYEQLLTSHDPDEEELTTGYLVARYGAGSYIYTSYVWYRQLKECHAGAFRCFANMLSYSKVRR